MKNRKILLIGAILFTAAVLSMSACGDPYYDGGSRAYVSVHHGYGGYGYGPGWGHGFYGGGYYPPTVIVAPPPIIDMPDFPVATPF